MIILLNPKADGNLSVSGFLLVHHLPAERFNIPLNLSPEA
jgi:hypothetical protein